MLTYYSATAREDFWTEHWGGHTVNELLAVARVSPLTTLITDALPPAGLVLEAGCGLGQYVILLRERGWRAAGVDGSVEALTACRRVAAVPLAASDLRALAIRSGALAAYVSLGVVEHDPDGPDAILAEARRMLAPGGGALVISVPYLNGVRRLGAPWIRRRQTALSLRGGTFYLRVHAARARGGAWPPRVHAASCAPLRSRARAPRGRPRARQGSPPHRGDGKRRARARLAAAANGSGASLGRRCTARRRSLARPHAARRRPPGVTG
jgi:SAM-dependent methyltransferase